MSSGLISAQESSSYTL